MAFEFIAGVLIALPVGWIVMTGLVLAWGMFPRASIQALTDPSTWPVVLLGLFFSAGAAFFAVMMIKFLFHTTARGAGAVCAAVVIFLILFRPKKPRQPMEDDDNA